MTTKNQSESNLNAFPFGALKAVHSQTQGSLPCRAESFGKAFHATVINALWPPIIHKAANSAASCVSLSPTKKIKAFEAGVRPTQRNVKNS